MEPPTRYFRFFVMLPDRLVIDDAECTAKMQAVASHADILSAPHLNFHQNHSLNMSQNPAAQERLELIQKTLTDIAGHQSEPCELREYDATSWTLFFEDEIGINLSYESAQDMLWIECDLERLDISDLMAAYEVALNHNFLERQTSSLMIGANTVDQTYLFRQPFNAAKVDVVPLEEAVGDFLKRVRAWKHVLPAVRDGQAGSMGGEGFASDVLIRI